MTKTVQADAAEGGIPAGTEFAVRANENIDTNQSGGTYSAEVAQTIEDRSGQVLVPTGSPAELTVVDASGGGAVGTRLRRTCGSAYGRALQRPSAKPVLSISAARF